LLGQNDNKSKEDEGKGIPGVKGVTGVFRDNKIPGFFKAIFTKLKEKIEASMPETQDPEQVVYEKKNRLLKFFLPSKNDMLVKMNSNLGAQDLGVSKSSFSEVIEEDTNFKASLFSKKNRAEKGGGGGGGASSVGSVQQNSFTSSHISIISSSKIPKVMKSFIFLLLFNLSLFMGMMILFLIEAKVYFFDFSSKVQDLTIPYEININYANFLGAGLDYSLVNNTNAKDAMLRRQLSETLLKIEYNLFVSLKNKIDRGYYQERLGKQTLQLTLIQDKDKKIVESMSVVQFLLAIAQKFYQYTMTRDPQDLHNLSLNFLSFSELCHTLFESFYDELESGLGTIRVFFISTCSAILGISILIVLINIPVLKKGNDLVEKILLIVTRISEKEVMEEVYRFRGYQRVLKSAFNDFINYDFLGVQRKKQILQDNMLENLQSYKGKTIRKGYLSSQITNQKLPSHNIFLFSMFTFSILVLFYSLVLYISLNSVDSFRPVLEDLKIEMDVHRMISSTLPLSQYQFNSHLLFTPEALNGLIDKYKDTQSKYLDSLKSLKSAYSFQGNNREDSFEISDLKRSNLCDLLKQEMKQFCDQKQSSLITHGLSGYLTELTSYTENTLNIIFGKENQETFAQATVIASSELFSDFVFANFLAIFAMRDVEQIMKTQDERLIDDVFQTNLIFFVAGGIGIGLILTVSFCLYFLKMRGEYLAVKKLLLLIPYTKIINDQNTFFLLKSLEKS
jgi:hypothetical protein